MRAAKREEGNGARTGEGDEETSGAAHRRQQHAFSNGLADESSPRGAQSHANGGL